MAELLDPAAPADIVDLVELHSGTRVIGGDRRRSGDFCAGNLVPGRAVPRCGHGDPLARRPVAVALVI